MERVSNMREDWLSVKGRMSMCAAAVVGGVLTLARLLCFARGVRKCNVVRDSPRISLTTLRYEGNGFCIGREWPLRITLPV